MIILPQLRLSVKSYLRGKQIGGFDMREGHSWVRNAYNTCAYLLLDLTTSAGSYGDGYINVKFTNGSTIATPAGWTWAGGAGVATGIVVGTGTTAFDFEDVALDTQVVNGTGAGQLTHTATDTITDAFVGDVVTTTGSRTFNNNSGDTIDIEEVGLYTFNNGSAMAARDVLGATVSVPDAGQLVVTYEISGDCSP